MGSLWHHDHIRRAACASPMRRGGEGWRVMDVLTPVSLAATDPELLRRNSERGAPAARKPRADRLGELRQRGGSRSDGVRDDQQVRRRLSRQALLRRLRVRRRRGDARHRAPEEDLRRGARQRSAARGRAGQHGGVHGACCSRATTCSACRSRTAATSRTARKSASAASCTTPSRTASSKDTERIDFDEVARWRASTSRS